jgi:pimeloyl-ACP methyl ester carboxylesterase
MAARALQSRFADNNGVRLHCIVAGTGELLLLLHGIPDFCNGWRRQIEGLSDRYCVAAMDLRGFNRSDKPERIEAYRMAELVTDVVTVVRAFDAQRVALIGHDWGAILAWWTAALYPGVVTRLAALSAPHPSCYLLARSRGELRYPREYLEQIVAAEATAPFKPSVLSAWVSQPSARRELEQALSRSDPKAIRNYYRANLASGALPRGPVPEIQASTLIMYGANDAFIPQHYYDESMKYVAGQCGLVAIPGAGHFIHQEAAECVNAELLKWLDATG